MFMLHGYIDAKLLLTKNRRSFNKLNVVLSEWPSCFARKLVDKCDDVHLRH